ncbi:MAG TPA: zinc-dependent peptidase [Phycisphaerales bacterium]|nr:zinc-dependent peptidase [Phycisphaerales bacterium]
MFGRKRKVRRRLFETPLPDAWWVIIDRNVPYIRSLTDEDRKELGGHIQILLHEKRFEGCGGLEMTDEIRLTIAAQAAVLLLHRKTDYYPTLRSILVYPHAYFSAAERRLPDGTVTDQPEARLGESWFRGSLVLSWDDVLRGAHNPSDGHNVVFHEFAHQLDGESGAMNGAPDLESPTRYQHWAQVLGHDYNKLIEEVHKNHRSLIDPYGSTDPAEFFAVVTETFFEKPKAMLHRHPELYRQLAEFYNQDPAHAETDSETP